MGNIVMKNTSMKSRLSGYSRIVIKYAVAGYQSVSNENEVDLEHQSPN